MKLLNINDRNKRKQKHHMLLATALCLSLGLSACGDKDLVHVNDAFTKPAIGIEKEMDAETSHMATALNSPSSDPIMSLDESGDIVVSDGNPVPDVMIAGKNGSVLNPKNMFGKNINSDQARINRLERAVQEMRNDFEMVKPSIKRLMALEGDMQKLISELERLNNSVPSRPKVAAKSAKPKPSSAAKKAASVAPASGGKPEIKNFETKTPPPVTGTASIYDVRVGEHTGKTRIVMDSNTKTPFKVDIDNNEKIMVVELSNARWDAAMSKNFARSPYISSYKIEDIDGGKMAIFQLKKNAKVLYKDDLKGFEGDSRRIVIDVGGT